MAAKLGLRLAFLNPSASPVWPPTGIALAALVLAGPRAWPGVFIGAFVANLTTAGTVWTSLGIASGNTLEALVGANLVTHYAGGRRMFDRVENILKFVLFGALISTTLSATIGVATLTLGGLASRTTLIPVWTTWWLGDAAGALIFTPLVILWAGPPVRWSPRQTLERAAFLAGLALIGWVVFSGKYPLEYLTVPFVFLAAFRFGQREAAALIVLLSLVAVWGTLNGLGPYAGQTPHQSLLALQAFMAILSVVTLIVAGVVAERDRAEADTSRLLGEMTEALQRSLLPAALPDIPGLRIAARYQPASGSGQIGGDWYDVTALPDGRVAVVIGDVAGHGVQAAAVMGQLRSMTRALAAEGYHPAEVAERLNRMMDPNDFATFIYMIIDPESGKAEYVNAGHLPPAIVPPDGSVSLLDPGSPPLGNRLYRYENFPLELTEGTTLILYTDGLIETTRAAQFDREHLLALLRRFPLDDLDAYLGQILSAALNGTPPRDDVALLGLQLNRLNPQRFQVRLPAVAASAPLARHALRRWLQQPGITEDDAVAVLIAGGEAVTNVIEHAYGPADGAVDIQASRLDDRVELIIRDWGRWRPSLKTGAGRGLQLIRHLMDQVEIDREATGTRVRLVRGLGRREAPL